MKRYHMLGNCHVDIAWHGDEEQYADYLEQYTVILLDMLEHYPDMTYVIEQAYHYRSLQRRRPDLVERLKAYIAQGRLEVVGGMISTADCNMPCGESLVRNQLIGLQWFKDEMNADVQTAWLTDTFGIHAQTPQFFHSFGLRQLIGTRFGGDKHHEIFWAEGLDGSRLLTMGKDCFSPNLPKPEYSRVFMDFVNEGAMIDAMFDRVQRTTLDGPIYVDVLMEDETYPNRRMMDRFYRLQRQAVQRGDEAVFSHPREFFRELLEYGLDYPVEFSDLNPEFTGTYSQRIEIRLHNRRTETALLDAEKWLVLKGIPYGKRFYDCWWDLGFVHFHDVFTGSHPESVFHDVLDRLKKTRSAAENAMTQIFESSPEGQCLQVTNSLPFPRREWISISSDAPRTVRCGEKEVPSFHSSGKLWFCAQVDACASAIYSLTPAECAQAFTPAQTEHITLGNEFVHLTVDARSGISLVEKNSGRWILYCAKDILVLQKDTGNFQIENIESTEQHAWADCVTIEQQNPYSVTISGCFEDVAGVPDANWTITLCALPGEPIVRLHIHTHWNAVGKRLRLKLNTTLSNAGEGIYEIPFGVVRRRPYTPGDSRKGEWPAQRFVAIEDGQFGLALINDGVPGVETLGGSMYTTLLRAPTQTYAGMIPDASSQQHGEHDFSFALLPYSGSWSNSGVLAMAQRWNSPVRTYNADEGAAPLSSLLRIHNDTIVLSAVKEAMDDEGVMILRMTESIGKEQTCLVTLPDAAKAYCSNMREEKLEPIPVDNGQLRLQFTPWQIRTIYIERTKQA